jgi:hypothetical protein
MNQEIRLDRSHEVFVHEPVAGIPSEPIAVVVHAPSGAVENATIGEVTRDRFASRLAEDAGLGAPWLTLFTTTGVTVGSRYLVGEAPDSEWVIVTSIEGPRVVVRRRLGREFGAGSRVRSGRLSIAVNPAWQRAQARQVELGGIGLSACTVRWSYAIDERITHAVDHADLVFTRRADIITPDEIEDRYPGWTQMIPIDHVATEIILEAHDLVRRDAARANVDLNNGVETRELVALRARMIAFEQEVIYGRMAAADLDAEQARYDRRAAELWKQLHRRPAIAPEPTRPSRPDPVLELRRWLETSRANAVAQWKQLKLFEERWLPRFTSSDELREAARLVRMYISARGLREMREAILRELERREP